jgi:hypothetical protein
MPFDCRTQLDREAQAPQVCFSQDYQQTLPVTTKTHHRIVQWMMKMTSLEVSHRLMLYSDPKSDLSNNDEVFSTEIYHIFTTIQHCCEHHG